MTNFPKAFLLLAGTIFLLSASCSKQEDTLAKIHVRDQNNELVPGASVRLHGEGKPPGVVIVDKTVTTNSSGEALFSFNDVYKRGQAGVAVLKIEVSKGGSTGEGIIKIVEETTSEETVFVQP